MLVLPSVDCFVHTFRFDSKEEAQTRTKLAEQIQREWKARAESLEHDLKETQVAFVDLKQQLEMEVAESISLNDTGL